MQLNGIYNMFSSEDNIMIKTRGTLEDFLPQVSSRNILTKIKTKTFVDFLRQLCLTSSMEHTAGSAQATVIPNCRYHCHD